MLNTVKVQWEESAKRYSLIDKRETLWTATEVEEGWQIMHTKRDGGQRHYSTAPDEAAACLTLMRLATNP
jgi:hypothetical protein